MNRVKSRIEFPISTLESLSHQRSFYRVDSLHRLTFEHLTFFPESAEHSNTRSVERSRKQSGCRELLKIGRTRLESAQNVGVSFGDSEIAPETLPLDSSSILMDIDRERQVFERFFITLTIIRRVVEALHLERC